MKVIHVSKRKGAHVVQLLANSYSPSNSHAVIYARPGGIKMVHGYLIKYDRTVLELLKQFPDEQQYEIVKLFRQKPFVKQYFKSDEDNL